MGQTTISIIEYDIAVGISHLGVRFNGARNAEFNYGSFSNGQYNPVGWPGDRNDTLGGGTFSLSQPSSVADSITLPDDDALRLYDAVLDFTVSLNAEGVGYDWNPRATFWAADANSNTAAAFVMTMAGFNISEVEFRGDPVGLFINQDVLGVGEPADFYAPAPCFPSGTLITLADGSQVGIETMQEGGEVKLREAGLSGTVTRLFSNVTDEWLELAWTDPATGEARQIVSTPGHVFLAPDGTYKRIIDMVDRTAHVASPLANVSGRMVGAGPTEHIPSECWHAVGGVDIVLDGGQVVAACVRSIRYGLDTAHLFEEAEMLVTLTEGGLACEPEIKRGWRTYNFEVAEYHNYIANGVHVHNVSAPWAHDKEDGSWERHLNDSLRNGTPADYAVKLANASTGVTTIRGTDEQVAYTMSGRRINLDQPTFDRMIDDAGGARAPRHKVDEAIIHGVIAGGGTRLDALAAVRNHNEQLGHDIGLGTPGRWHREIKEAQENFNSGSGGAGQDPIGQPTPKPAPAPQPESSSGKGGGSAPAPAPAPTPAPKPESSSGKGGGSKKSSKSKDNSDSDSDSRPSSSSGKGGGGRRSDDDGGSSRKKPVLLDLDGDGIDLTVVSESTEFVVGEGGLLHRTAWAGAGDGVLFYDPDDSGEITEMRQFVFTEWDPTASSDVEALKNVFDSNGDGVFDAQDDAWAEFKIMVSNADGSTSASALDALGIAEIDLDVDATNIVLPDGSVITGQTEFTYADGTTGLVGDVMLAVDANGYDVEESVFFDGNGNRVAEQKGYNQDGSLAFVITTVTSPDGSAITNSHDDNGDGVVDRVQTIDLVTNPDGSTVRTVTNYAGSTVLTGVLVNQTVTMTSADGSSVTIQRDSLGGGWFDQIETRTEQADGSWLNVTQDLAKDGTVIASISETVSADGLTRSEAIDEDGDGSIDLTVNHAIMVNPYGSRSETVTTLNSDGSVRSSMVETISADGKAKWVDHDRDGDGIFEEIVETTIFILPDGSTSSSIVVKNGDGTFRSTHIQDQSADARTKTIVSNPDGDGDFDATRVEQTIINPDGSRQETITVTNFDGSINSMVKQTLGADKISGQTWVDLNENGTFEATDLVRDVSVDGITGDVTAVDYARNDDGTLRAQTTTVTSADGLTSTQSIDADGDGDIDAEISEVTSVNGYGEAVTVTETRNQDGTLRSKSTSTTSTDGLTTTVEIDADGDGDLDSVTTTQLTNNPDGSVTSVTETYAGDGTTLLGSTQTDQSADRRSSTVSVDEDGDGNVDLVEQTDEALDGAHTVLTTAYHNDGGVASTVSSAVSADGLSTSSDIDSDGDGIVETNTQSDTVLNADGSRATTIIVSNGDGSERSRTVETISDDGLTVTLESDADGDGVFETKTVSTTTLNIDGSQTVRAEQFAADGTSLSVIETESNDDGLVVTVRTDSDSDGTFDLVSVATTTLLADGGRETVEEVRDAAGVLRSSIKTSVSDDGELTIVERDLNGDGLIDEKEIRTVQDNGSVETLIEQLAPDGSAQSVRKTVTSDDGLVVTTSLDRTGDGVFETVQTATALLNADGSKTTTAQTFAEDGTIIDRVIADVSDDGLNTTRREDWDNDGDFDRTIVEQTTLNLDGSVTQTSQTNAANGDLLLKTTQTTSGDGRSVTTNQDADGNGVDDSVMAWTLADDGTVTATVDYFTAGGILEASTTSVTSADGLTIRTVLDRNGDGYADFVTNDTTSLAANGSTRRVVDHSDGWNASLAREEYTVSDDGLVVSISFDVDGDDVLDFVTSDVTTLNADGSVTQLIETDNASGNLLWEYSTTISGDRLTQVDVTSIGSEQINRTVTTIASPEGGYTEMGDGTGADWETILSADGRTLTVHTDIDSDDQFDWSMRSHINADRSVTETYQDLGATGAVESGIVSTVSANGQSQTVALDVDGDGTTDINRTRDVTFDSAGNQIVTITETYADGSLAYHEVQTTSGDGNLITRTIDQDGDGVADGTTTTTITLNDDGSQETKTETRYVDGELRESSMETISADGRTVTTERDYDGNGIADKKTVLEVRSDGEQVLTETVFSKAGVPGSVYVTTTSADGLHQTIVGDGLVQTITRSPLDNGSYVWDNGDGLIVEHRVDANGIATWTDGTVTVTLDAASKVRILEEAARIFDTVLDRGMQFIETETLLVFVQNGELDREALSAALLESNEFTTRHGAMSYAEFINHLFLNSYGRTATLDEMAENLGKLVDGTSRAEIAMEMAESAEHHFVGNVHRATNNYDVLMKPAQGERVLDKSTAFSDIEKLVQAMFDRAPTAHELEYYAEQLLDGTADGSDLVLEMMRDASDGGLHALSNLDGEQLVNQAFLNALGRPPTTDEIGIWAGWLADETLSEVDFVFLLAMSIDADAAERTHGAGTPGTYQVIDGTSGDDVLNGTSAAELITGGLGDDMSDGEEGSDTYIWAKGDGNDIISDTSRSRAETDRLLLTDVYPDDVYLHRTESSFHTGIEDELWIELVSTGERISIHHWYTRHVDGQGIEELEFADGTIWTVDEISERAVVNGTNSDNNFYGSAKDENLYGFAGDDTLRGNDGDDTIVGGLGDDWLVGGSGSDTFIWSKGDGSDTIDSHIDPRTIDDFDTLVLADVASDDVRLISQSSDDMGVEILSTGELLTIRNQFRDDTSADWGGGRAVAAGYGIEQIDFADGVTWHLQEIYEAATAREVHYDTDLHDNLRGDDGDNRVDGDSGDDRIEGGLGVDDLEGGTGSDTYIWKKGDGGDTIDDRGTSIAEIDKLLLTDVNADDVRLVRPDGTDRLDVVIVSTSETIKILNRFSAMEDGKGVEEIHFADGSVWNLFDIKSRTRIEGDNSANVLTGYESRDNVYGHDGNDTLIGGAGGDRLDGGAGIDRAKYSDAGSGLTADLDNPANNTGIAAGDIYISIENLHGSRHNDTLHGDSARNTIWGWDGADVLRGRGGVDALVGGQGNDTLDAGSGSDDPALWQVLRGGADNDTYVVRANSGSVHIDAHAENATTGTADRVRFVDLHPSDFEISIDANNKLLFVWDNGTHAGQLKIADAGQHIERFEFADGSSFASISIDTNGRLLLHGSSGDDLIVGGMIGPGDGTGRFVNDNRIFGNNGNDTIILGASAWGDWQWAYGQNGNDTYVINADVGSVFIGLQAEDATKGAADRVVFSELYPSDFDISIDANNELLFVWDNGTHTGQLKIADAGQHIEVYEFADGSAVSSLDIDTLGRVVAYGTPNDDLIVGGMTGRANGTVHPVDYNRLYGGNGNDTIVLGASAIGTWQWAYGQYGNDTYVIGADVGSVLIWANEVADTGIADRVVFPDLNLSDMTVSIFEGTFANGSLRFEWDTGAEAGELRVYEGGQYIEAYEFADGTIVSSISFGANSSLIFKGTTGNDLIAGTDGNDHLIGGAGADRMDGGTGIDRAQYSDSSSGLTADLDNPANNTGIAAGDIYTSIENLHGSRHNDTLNGDSARNTIWGWDGADVLRGRGGVDTLVGGQGNDTLDAGSGSNDLTLWQVLRGGADNDTYVVRANSGSVHIDAHAENATTGTADRVRFVDLHPSDFEISIDANNKLLFVWDNGTHAGQLKIADAGQHIERFEFADGSVVSSIGFADDGRPRFYGTDGDDYIVGGTLSLDAADNPFLYGGNGNDTLVPGAIAWGNWQRVYGQHGNDTYVINADVGAVFIDLHAENATTGTADRVVFSDLNPSDFDISINANNQLRLFWNNGVHTGQLNVHDAGAHIEAYEFADGSVVSSIGFADDGRPRFYGTDGDDYIVGGTLSLDAADNPFLYGGNGNDTLVPGAIAWGNWQRVYGQHGNDTYVINADVGTVFIDLHAENATTGTADRVVFSDLNPSDFDISINANNQLRLFWNNGVHTGQLNVHDAGAHIEAYEFADGSVVSSIGFTPSGSLILTGTTGHDHINGTDGNDTLIGGAGADVLTGGVGADVLNGSTGIDTASYVGSNAGVTVDLRGASGWGVYGGHAEGDTFVSIENLSGSSSGDTFVGAGTDNRILGHGVGGDDRIFGGNGDDLLHGNNGNDELYGNNGDDRLQGHSGADVLDGGDGWDIARYSEAVLGVTANLSDVSQNTGDAAGDSYVSIEALEGSRHSDNLIGDDANNTIWGLAGDDVISGGEGNDMLLGGLGADTLIGGSGDDVFEFSGDFGADTIMDFTNVGGEQDKIRFVDQSDWTFADLLAVASDSGNGAMFELGNGADVTLSGMPVASLSSNDFLFG